MSRYTGGGGYLPLTWWLGGSSLDLWFTGSKFYDASLGSPESAVPTTYFSCSRASTGYARTAAGTLTSFATNTLRYTDNGLLVEGSKTNVALQSQTLDNATWTKNALSVTADATTAPDGTTTADLLIPDTTTTNGHNDDQLVGGNADGVYTVSAYVKAAGYNFVLFDASDNTTGDLSCAINLTTGATTIDILGVGSWTGRSATSEQLANGWWRVTMTGTKSTGGFLNIEIRIYPTPNNTFTAFAGDGTSGAYVWGVQLEASSAVSSYIPTTTASVTRAADNITITGVANTLINAAAASAIVRVGTSPGSSFAANIIDSNGTNCLGFDSTNHGLASITATLATSNTANRSMTVDDKVGLAWSGAGRSLVLNGGTVATDAIAQTPSATQNLGSASGTSNFINAYIERFTLWSSKQSDASMQGFTGP